MKQIRRSKWEFNTSNGAGLSMGIVGAEGGSVTLKDPQGKPTVFYYGAVGAGLSVGVKLPKLGKIKLPGLTGSSEQFTSGGLLYMSPMFSRDELTVDDINGGCMFLEVGAESLGEVPRTPWAFGMNEAAMFSGILQPALLIHALSTAVGYMVFAGTNYGLQAGLGVSEFVGVMHAGSSR